MGRCWTERSNIGLPKCKDCSRAWNRHTPKMCRFTHKVLDAIIFSFSFSSGPALLSGVQSVPERVEGMEKSMEFLKVCLSTSSVILGSQKHQADTQTKLIKRKPPVIK